MQTFAPWRGALSPANADGRREGFAGRRIYPLEHGSHPGSVPWDLEAKVPREHGERWCLVTIELVA